MRFAEVQKTFDVNIHDVYIRFAVVQTATDKTELEMGRKLGETRTYVDTRFNDLLGTMNVYFTSIQIAIDKAEVSINTRLEGMNEFRDQLKDQSAQFVIRLEFAGVKDQVGQCIGKPEFTGLKDQATEHVTRAEFASIQKLIYIGLGAVLDIELLLKFL